MIPWEAIQWTLGHPELGWVVLGVWLLFEFRSERGRIASLNSKLTSAIIVIRALARKEGAIDEEKVDDYLVENGMEPEDFLVEDKEAVASQSLLGEEDDSPNKDEHSAE